MRFGVSPAHGNRRGESCIRPDDCRLSNSGDHKDRPYTDHQPILTYPGAYFVTVCTWLRECLLGHVVNGEIRLNEHGLVVHKEWLKTAKLRGNVEVEVCTIMPNHLHGIVGITNCRDTARRAPTERFGKSVAQSISTIMRAFKSASTKHINEIRVTPGMPVWQRNYYEHVVRNDEELEAIRQYVLNNPANWVTDENYRV